MHIFKRRGASSYSVRFQFQGKDYWKSLDTDIKAVAQKRAKDYREEVRAQRWENVERLKVCAKNQVTIGQLVDCYKANNKGPKPSLQTVRRNIMKFMLVVTEGLGLTADQARQKSVKVLNEDLAWAFQKARIAKMNSDLDGQASSAVTIISTLRCARGLFSADAMMHYKLAGLEVPKIKLKCSHNQLPDKDTRYTPLHPDMVQKMEAAAIQLKEKHPEQYKAYILESRLALRASEVVAARWNWIERGATETTLAVIKRSDFDPKGSEGRVPISPELLQELESYRNGRADTDYIIVAPTDTDRRALVERQLSKWLRTFIPDRPKTNHELRKHCISIVLTKTKSIAHAQRFARHASPETTMQVYGTLLEQLPSVSTADWTATATSSQTESTPNPAPQPAA